MPDEDIKKAWGNQLYAESVGKKKKGNLVKMAKALDSRFTGKTDQEAIPVIKNSLDLTEISPETTQTTLGKPFNKVGGDTLLRAASKLLGINRGTDKVDNRDALEFKELWSIQDHIPERIGNSARRIQFKMKNNLDRKSEVKSIITSDVFNVPVKSFFTTTSFLSKQQVNPIDMVGGFLRSTIMGPGGIQSDNAITDAAKLIDNSHVGFIDPIHTPEGSRSGISTHLTMGALKEGKTPKVRVYNIKTKKFENLSPKEIKEKNLAFPDQYKKGEKGERVPKKKQITIMPKGGGDPKVVPSSEVDYILGSTKQLFSITSNLVPFLPADQANRAGMATRHMEQAISLKNREQPLIQVASGSSIDKRDTWEKILGRTNSHVTRVRYRH